MKPKDSKLEDIPLVRHNEVARRERDRLDAMQADAARAAMEAVQRAFQSAPSVDEVIQSVAASAKKGTK